jgi:hypothetical protein
MREQFSTSHLDEIGVDLSNREIVRRCRLAVSVDVDRLNPDVSRGSDP